MRLRPLQLPPLPDKEHYLDLAKTDYSNKINTFDQLYENEDFKRDLREYYDLRGLDAPEDDKELVDRYVADRAFEDNNILVGTFLGRMHEASIAQGRHKELLTKMQKVWSRLPTPFEEGGRDFAPAIGQMLQGSLSDPTTYLGFVLPFARWAGVAATRAALAAGVPVQEAVKQGTKSYARWLAAQEAGLSAGTLGAADVGQQSAEIELGLTDDYSPSRTIRAAGIGAATGAALSYPMGRLFGKREVREATRKDVLDDIGRISPVERREQTKQPLEQQQQRLEELQAAEKQAAQLELRESERAARKEGEKAAAEQVAQAPGSTKSDKLKANNTYKAAINASDIVDIGGDLAETELSPQDDQFVRETVRMAQDALDTFDSEGNIPKPLRKQLKERIEGMRKVQGRARPADTKTTVKATPDGEEVTRETTTGPSAAPKPEEAPPAPKPEEAPPAPKPEEAPPAPKPEEAPPAPKPEESEPATPSATTPKEAPPPSREAADISPDEMRDELDRMLSSPGSTEPENLDAREWAMIFDEAEGADPASPLHFYTDDDTLRSMLKAFVEEHEGTADPDELLRAYRGLQKDPEQGMVSGALPPEEIRRKELAEELKSRQDYEIPPSQDPDEYAALRYTTTDSAGNRKTRIKRTGSSPRDVFNTIQELKRKHGVHFDEDSVTPGYKNRKRNGPFREIPAKERATGQTFPDDESLSDAVQARLIEQDQPQSLSRDRVERVLATEVGAGLGKGRLAWAWKSPKEAADRIISFFRNANEYGYFGPKMDSDKALKYLARQLENRDKFTPTVIVESRNKKGAKQYAVVRKGESTRGAVWLKKKADAARLQMDLTIDRLIMQDPSLGPAYRQALDGVTKLSEIDKIRTRFAKAGERQIGSDAKAAPTFAPPKPVDESIADDAALPKPRQRTTQTPTEEINRLRQKFLRTGDLTSFREGIRSLTQGTETPSGPVVNAKPVNMPYGLDTIPPNRKEAVLPLKHVGKGKGQFTFDADGVAQRSDNGDWAPAGDLRVLTEGQFRRGLSWGALEGDTVTGRQFARGHVSKDWHPRSASPPDFELVTDKRIYSAEESLTFKPYSIKEFQSSNVRMSHQDVDELNRLLERYAGETGGVKGEPVPGDKLIRLDEAVNDATIPTQVRKDTGLEAPLVEVSQQWPQSLAEYKTRLRDIRRANALIAKYAPGGWVKPAKAKAEAIQKLQAAIDRLDINDKSLLGDILYGRDVVSRAIQSVRGQFGPDISATAASPSFVSGATNRIKLNSSSGNLAIEGLHELGHWVYSNVLSPEEKYEFWQSLAKHYLIEQKNFSPASAPSISGQIPPLTAEGGNTGGILNAYLTPAEYFANQMAKYVLSHRKDIYQQTNRSMLDRIVGVMRAAFGWFTDRKAIDPDLHNLFEKVLPRYAVDENTLRPQNGLRLRNPAQANFNVTFQQINGMELTELRSLRDRLDAGDITARDELVEAVTQYERGVLMRLIPFRRKGQTYAQGAFEPVRPLANRVRDLYDRIHKARVGESDVPVRDAVEYGEDLTGLTVIQEASAEELEKLLPEIIEIGEKLDASMRVHYNLFEKIHDVDNLPADFKLPPDELKRLRVENPELRWDYKKARANAVSWRGYEFPTWNSLNDYQKRFEHAIGKPLRPAHEYKRMTLNELVQEVRNSDSPDPEAVAALYRARRAVPYIEDAGGSVVPQLFALLSKTPKSLGKNKKGPSISEWMAQALQDPKEGTVTFKDIHGNEHTYASKDFITTVNAVMRDRYDWVGLPPLRWVTTPRAAKAVQRAKSPTPTKAQSHAAAITPEPTPAPKEVAPTPAQREEIPASAPAPKEPAPELSVNGKEILQRIANLQDGEEAMTDSFMRSITGSEDPSKLATYAEELAQFLAGQRAGIGNVPRMLQRIAEGVRGQPMSEEFARQFRMMLNGTMSWKFFSEKNPASVDAMREAMDIAAVITNGMMDETAAKKFSVLTHYGNLSAEPGRKAVPASGRVPLSELPGRVAEGVPDWVYDFVRTNDVSWDKASSAPRLWHRTPDGTLTSELDSPLHDATAKLETLKPRQRSAAVEELNAYREAQEALQGNVTDADATDLRNQMKAAADKLRGMGIEVDPEVEPIVLGVSKTLDFSAEKSVDVTNGLPQALLRDFDPATVQAAISNLPKQRMSGEAFMELVDQLGKQLSGDASWTVLTHADLGAYDSVLLPDGSLKLLDENAARPLLAPGISDVSVDMQTGLVPATLPASYEKRSIPNGVRVAGEVPPEIVSYMKAAQTGSGPTPRMAAEASEFYKARLAPRTHAHRIHDSGWAWVGSRFNSLLPAVDRTMAQFMLPALDALASLPDGTRGMRKLMRHLTQLGTLGIAKGRTPKSHAKILNALRAGPSSPEFRALSSREAQVAAVLRRSFDGMLAEMRKAGMAIGRIANFVPQVWDAGALAANARAATDALAEYFMREQPGLAISEARQSASDIVMELTQNDGILQLHDFRPKRSKNDLHYSRKLNFEDHPDIARRLRPFLVNDIDLLVAKYFANAANQLETVKRFGLDSHALADYQVAWSQGERGLATLLSKGKVFYRDQSGHFKAQKRVAGRVFTPFTSEKDPAVSAAIDALKQAYHSGADVGALRQMLETLAPVDQLGWKRRAEAIANAIVDSEWFTRTAATDMRFGQKPTNIYDYVERVARVMSHRPVEYPNTTLFGVKSKSIAQVLKTVSSTTLLSGVTLTSAGDPLLALVNSPSMLAAARGVGRALRDPDYREFIRSSGIAIESALHARQAGLYQLESAGRLGRINTAFFALTGLTKWTDWNRYLAGAIGLEAFRAMQKKAQAGNNVFAQRYLRRYGLTPTTPLDGVEAQEAMIRFANDSIYMPNANDIPLFVQSPIGSVMYQFKMFGHKMAQMGDRMIDDALGKQATPQGMKNLLLFLTALPAGGMAIAALKDILYSRGKDKNGNPISEVQKRTFSNFFSGKQVVDVSPGRMDPNELLGWYLEGALISGGLGAFGEMLVDAARQSDNGFYGAARSVGNAALGPTFGLATDTFSVVQGATDTGYGNAPERRAVRSVVRRIPGVQLNREVVESLVDAIAGEPRSDRDADKIFGGL